MRNFLLYTFCLFFFMHISLAQQSNMEKNKPYTKVVKTNKPNARAITKGSLIILNIKQYLDTVLTQDNGKKIVYQEELGNEFLNMKEGDNIFMAQSLTAVSKDPIEYKNLITRIEILKVLDKNAIIDTNSLLEEIPASKRMAEEDSKIQQFLKDREIQAQKLPNGTYIEIIKKGDSNVVIKEKTRQLTVRYRGILLDNGLVFHQNMKPNQSSLVYSTDKYEFLPVCEELLQTMQKGAHFRLYIPSSLAFGKRQIPNILPAYSNLVYEFLLEDVHPISKKNKKNKN